MFDVGGWELFVLVIAALFVFGPDRLPQVTAQAVRALRQLRAMASGAREQLTDAIGPELNDLDVMKDLRDLNQLNQLRKLDPRAMIANALMDEGGSSVSGNRKPAPNGNVAGAAGSGADDRIGGVPTLDQLLGDAARLVDGDREPQTDGTALVAARAAQRGDRRVDTDDPPPAVDEWTAGVARVDRRVGLQGAQVRRLAPVGGAGRHRTVGRTDDAGCDRTGEPEWRADRDALVADDDAVGVAERDDGQAGPGDFDHGQVVRRRTSDDPARRGRPVVEVDRDGPAVRGVCDDVVVRHDVAVRLNDEARAGATGAS